MFLPDPVTRGTLITAGVLRVRPRAAWSEWRAVIGIRDNPGHGHPNDPDDPPPGPCGFFERSVMRSSERTLSMTSPRPVSFES
jgi:hypothetical protein